MEKILNICKFLKDVFYKADEEERYKLESKFKLNKKIDLRVTKGEYEIIEKMCQLHNISISEYFRNLNMTYIDKFIIDSEPENRYNGPLKTKKAS